MERGKTLGVQQVFRSEGALTQIHSPLQPPNHFGYLSARNTQKLPGLAASLSGGDQIGAAQVSEVLPVSRGCAKLEHEPG